MFTLSKKSLIFLSVKGKESPGANRHSVYDRLSVQAGNPRLYEKPKQWDYIPHCCEKIKDIHQGKKCIFNLVARTRKRFI